jgi:hypothetical protein
MGAPVHTKAGDLARRAQQQKFTLPGHNEAVRMAMKQWNLQVVFESIHPAAYRRLAEAKRLARMGKRPRRRAKSPPLVPVHPGFPLQGTLIPP